jgi:tripartite-type tricarboxylate transporter receptor subunit TctC
MAREKEKSGELLNIIGRLNAATVEALKAQDMRDFLARYGAEPLGSTPEQMKRYFASETAKYARLVRASKAAAE